MIDLSVSMVPRFAIFEFLFLFKFECHLSKFIFVDTNFEFLADMLVLEPVRLIVLTPFWHKQFFVEKETLFQKLVVVFSVGISTFAHIFDVFFNISALVLSKVRSIEHFSGCLFCLLAMNDCELMHLFQMFF